MIVAIDGPSGSGKSSVAREVARRCGLTYRDTGARYRSVALACLERGVDPEDAPSVAEVARTARVEFVSEGDGQRVLLDGRDVTAQIRTPEVELAVSPVSANPEVRETMVALQRACAASGDVVAEGRDIGTVVFPSAEVKVFLSASPEARARRRAVQRRGGNLATGDDVDVDAEVERAILADLVRRDEYDSSREASPLRAAEDAVAIDSSELGFNEVVERMNLDLSGVKMKQEHTAELVPVLVSKDGTQEQAFPSIVVNGKIRNRALKREEALTGNPRYTNVNTTIRRKNGEAQTVDYQATAPF